MYAKTDFLNRIRGRAAARRRGEYLGERLGKGLCFAQADMVVANAAGAAVRADINAQLEAVATQQSGSSAPSTTYPYQVWADTTNGVLRRRNAANSAWLDLGTLDETFVLSRSSDTMLDRSDRGKTIRATGSYTQTFDAVATLGDSWWIGFRVESGATLTFDPNSTETIDGASTLAVVGPASGFVVCNGAALFTVGLAGAVTQPTVTILTSGSGTYTTPAGVKRIVVECWGGGASGGGGTSGSGFGTGGGAGAYCKKLIVSPSATYSYAVGAAGAAAAYGAAGNNGGTTTFGSLSAGGGTGGPTAASDRAGGAGGTASGGDINISGGAGAADYSVSVPNLFMGYGGGSPVGGPASMINAGAAGNAPGGGGAGGSKGSGNSGAGGAGRIVVWEYYA